MWFAVVGLGGGLLLLAWALTVVRRGLAYDAKVSSSTFARHTEGYSVGELLAEIAKRDALAAEAATLAALQDAPTREFARV